MTSSRLQERVVQVTQRAVDRIHKITRQWLALKANEYRLNQFKDAGDIPKTMRVELPCPTIQTLGYKYEPSDTVKTAWQTAHQLMFEEFLSQHHDATVQKETELASMLPSLKDEDIDKFLKLVLEMREDTLETEMPPLLELSTSVLQAFWDQLD